MRSKKRQNIKFLKFNPTWSEKKEATSHMNILVHY